MNKYKVHKTCRQKNSQTGELTESEIIMTEGEIIMTESGIIMTESGIIMTDSKSDRQQAIA